MKYIRTKDGRILAYGTGEDSGYSKGCIRIQNKPKISATCDPIEILKEADTIEELFDEVVRVVHYTKAKPSFVRPLPGDWEERGKDAFAKAMEKCLEEQRQMKIRGDDFDLYGAIWTKGGLIYVAKMNKKGELELL